MVEDRNPEERPHSSPTKRDLSDNDATRNSEGDSSRAALSNRQRARAAERERIKLPERFGRYRIVRELGSGAMGVVYLARDTQLDREVALKIPLFGDQSQLVVDRFYREARSMAMLRHPNLCDVYDVGEIDGVHFLAMAYIKGRSLFELLVEKQPLNNREIATFVFKLALALDQAHRAGVIHRDLKPSNVIVDESNEPVVMDFGLARRESQDESQLTREGAVLGTPAYMSPEQVEGRHDDVGPASDTYSLGVILFQLLTRRLPFEGPPVAVFGKILVMEPPRPSSLGVKVDPFLESVCMQAIAKKPEERFRSGAAMAAELQQFLEGKAPGKGKDGPRVITQSEAAVAGRSSRLRRHRSAISALAFAPNHQYALSGSRDGQIVLWDLPDQSVVHHLDGHTDCVQSISFAHDGKRAVTCSDDGTLCIWDVRRATVLKQFEQHQGVSHQAKFAGKNDRFLVTAGPDDAVCVWNVGTAKIQRQFVGHRGFVLGIAVSPDGRRIASASNDRSVRLWDVQTAEEIPLKMRHKESVNSVAFSPDGRLLLSASKDANICLWDLATGKEVRRLEVGRSVVAMEVSRDGTQALTATNDGLVAIWDVESGKRLMVLDGHRQGVTSIALASGMQSCLSGGNEHDVIFWTL